MGSSEKRKKKCTAPILRVKNHKSDNISFWILSKCKWGRVRRFPRSPPLLPLSPSLLLAVLSSHLPQHISPLHPAKPIRDLRASLPINYHPNQCRGLWYRIICQISADGWGQVLLCHRPHPHGNLCLGRAPLTLPNLLMGSHCALQDCSPAARSPGLQMYKHLNLTGGYYRVPESTWDYFLKQAKRNFSWFYLRCTFKMHHYPIWPAATNHTLVHERVHESRRPKNTQKIIIILQMFTWLPCFLLSTENSPDKNIHLNSCTSTPLDKMRIRQKEMIEDNNIGNTRSGVSVTASPLTVRPAEALNSTLSTHELNYSRYN